MNEITATAPATPAEKARMLAREEQRIEGGMDAIERGTEAVRLGLYLIHKHALWKAVVDEEGRQAFQHLNNYFTQRWADRISRSAFFDMPTALMRLETLGLDPKRLIEEGPGHNFDINATRLLGDAWDYKSKHLTEPSEGLRLVCQETGEGPEEAAKRLYEEAVAAECSGLGLGNLRTNLKHSQIDVYRRSPPDDPLVLEIVVGDWRSVPSEEPIYQERVFRLCSHQPLPPQLEEWICRRLRAREGEA